MIKFTSEQINVLADSERDIIYFAENYFYYQDKNTKLPRLPKLTDSQKAKLIEYSHKPSEYNSIAISVKNDFESRFLANIFIFWYSTFSLNKTIGVVAKKKLYSKSVIEDLQYAYLNLPEYMKHSIIKWNKSEIGYSTHCNIIAEKTTASTKKDPFSGVFLKILYKIEDKE